MVAGGNIQTFAGLISENEIFEVPDFQRNYSWEPKQVEELYGDIVKSASSSQESHFVGSVILLKSAGSGNRVLVVDGQQRLTTLFLLIALIRDKAHSLSIQSLAGGAHEVPKNPLQDAQNILLAESGDGVYRFSAHPMVTQMVKNNIFHFPNPQREALPNKHYKHTLPLRKSHKKLSELLDSSLKSFESEEDKLTFLHEVLKTIKYKLKLLNVRSDSTAEAYEIFMTLNSRGMPLGASDLVKSEIFKHLTKGLEGQQAEQKSSELTNSWNEIVKNLELGDLEQFLRHFVVSKYEGSMTSKRLFDRIRVVINGTDDEPRDAKVEAAALLKELIVSSGIYANVLEGSIEGLLDAKLTLQLLNEILDSYRIFLMVVADSRVNLSKAERLELIRLTEVLAFRWVLVGLNAQKLEDIFQDLSLKLRGGEEFLNLKVLIVQQIPKDETVKRQFEETVDSASIVRVVLYKINREKWDQTGLIGYDAKKIHVEHIAPDTATPHWLDVLFPNVPENQRQVEYDAAVELWGNKTILEQKINQKVKQGEFLEKARGLTEDYSGYGHSQLDITKDLGSNFTAWGRDAIAKRSEWIADMFIHIWSAEPQSDNLEHFSTWVAD